MGVFKKWNIVVVACQKFSPLKGRMKDQEFYNNSKGSVEDIKRVKDVCHKEGFLKDKDIKRAKNVKTKR